MDNFTKLRNIAIEQFMIKEEDFKKESLLVDDFLGDSLDITEFILEVEEVFDIEIDDTKILKETTVQDILNFIEN